MQRLGLLMAISMLFTFGNSVLASDSKESDLERERRLGEAYVAEMALEGGAFVVDSGVVMRAIFESQSSERPAEDSIVQVIYHLADREGNLIEESFSSDSVAAFPLNRLIECWKIALPRITVGSLYKVTCPTDTAYGDRGAGSDILPGAALTFRISLLGVQEPASADE